MNMDLVHIKKGETYQTRYFFHVAVQAHTSPRFERWLTCKRSFPWAENIFNFSIIARRNIKKQIVSDAPGLAPIFRVVRVEIAPLFCRRLSFQNHLPLSPCLGALRSKNRANTFWWQSTTGSVVETKVNIICSLR